MVWRGAHQRHIWIISLKTTLRFSGSLNASLCVSKPLIVLAISKSTSKGPWSGVICEVKKETTCERLSYYSLWTCRSSAPRKDHDRANVSSDWNKSAQGGTWKEYESEVIATPRTVHIRTCNIWSQSLIVWKQIKTAWRAHSAYSHGAVNQVPLPSSTNRFSSALYTFTYASPSSGIDLQVRFPDCSASDS